jgi:hypothetical protein
LGRERQEVRLSKSKENIRHFSRKSQKHVNNEYRFSEANLARGKKTNPFVMSRYSESKSKGKQAPRPTMEKHRYISPTSKPRNEANEASLRHLLRGTKIQAAKGLKKYRQAKTSLTEGD